MSVRVVVLDTETTGMKDPVSVCECAFVELDPDTLEVVRREHSLIDPERPIQPSASGIHGITDDMVVDAPTLEEWFMDVLKDPFADDYVLLVAHNAGYDYPLVETYLGCGSRKLCTLRLSRMAFPDGEVDDHKLATLKYTFGLGAKGSKSHGAAADTDDCVDLLRLLCSKFGTGINGLIDIHDAPLEIKVMPFGKHKGEKLVDVPKSYFSWLKKQDNVDPDLLVAIDKL